ncbi:Thioredoxin domain-containing protein 17-like protein [Mycena venus]|uniref:Thioredoxin domain-containing protein 17-like protein n=1 Tax=Mycena venus TaxID=2733690 RepID=A0A8H7D4S0_9AGAR|nr:Thioredoxin domain-containing protein 17-like protein [Mycena venus]
MPIQTTDKLEANESLLTQDGYVLFYASLVDGQPWCSDCRAIYDKVQKAFSRPERPPLTILQVGLEPEWKSPDNIFRGSPWKVSGIPTLFQVDKGAVAHRYEEDPDIIKKLDEIIG